LIEPYIDIPGEAFPCGRNKSWCRGENYTIPIGNTTTTLGQADQCLDISGNPIDMFNATLLEEEGEFCCPYGLKGCLMGYDINLINTTDYIGSLSKDFFTPALLGCVNETLGETCCSTSICSPGNKCCKFPLPENWDSHPNSGVNLIKTNATVNDLDICCPIGTTCCAKILPVSGSSDYFDPESSRFSNSYIFAYCGRNSNCTSISSVSEMFQLSPSLSKSGFLPDYIEHLGWLGNPIDFFSAQLQSVTSDPNIFNDICFIDSNGDYCGLKSPQEDKCVVNVKN